MSESKARCVFPTASRLHFKQLLNSAALTALIDTLIYVLWYLRRVGAFSYHTWIFIYSTWKSPHLFRNEKVSARAENPGNSIWIDKIPNTICEGRDANAPLIFHKKREALVTDYITGIKVFCIWYYLQEKIGNKEKGPAQHFLCTERWVKNLFILHYERRSCEALIKLKISL